MTETEVATRRGAEHKPQQQQQQQHKSNLQRYGRGEGLQHVLKQP